MVYVEWLRVRGALKCTAIVLGILLAIAVVCRVAIVGLEHNAMSRITQLQNDPHSRVTRTTLPDGTSRITIDNTADKTQIVIDDHGYAGKHIEILDRSSRSHDRESVVSGSIHVQTLPSHGGTLTTIDTNGSTKFVNYVLLGSLVAMIIATVLGAPFARENDGHLELALTKPIDRIGLAVRTIGIDAAGIAASVLLGIVFGIAAHTLFGLPHITFDWSDAISLALGILGPLAWYAMLAAATASLKRGYGAILGFAWPIALIVVGLTLVRSDNPLLELAHNVCWVLSFIDPLTYIHLEAPKVTSDQTILDFNWQQQLAMLVVLAFGYGALAVVQWRRIES